MKSPVGLNKELRKAEKELREEWREYSSYEDSENVNPMTADLAGDGHIQDVAYRIRLASLRAKVRALRWALGIHRNKLNEAPK